MTHRDVEQYERAKRAIRNEKGWAMYVPAMNP